MTNQNSNHYPYTYAADYLRMSLGREADFSRADASKVRTVIAEACGMDDDELACCLADQFIEHEQELVDKAVADFMLRDKPTDRGDTDRPDDAAFARGKKL